jgi:hypothetical protein
VIFVVRLRLTKITQRKSIGMIIGLLSPQSSNAPNKWGIGKITGKFKGLSLVVSGTQKTIEI